MQQTTGLTSEQDFNVSICRWYNINDTIPMNIINTTFVPNYRALTEK